MAAYNNITVSYKPFVKCFGGLNGKYDLQLTIVFILS